MVLHWGARVDVLLPGIKGRAKLKLIQLGGFGDVGSPLESGQWMDAMARCQLIRKRVQERIHITSPEFFVSSS